MSAQFKDHMCRLAHFLIILFVTSQELRGYFTFSHLLCWWQQSGANQHVQADDVALSCSRTASTLVWLNMHRRVLLNLQECLQFLPEHFEFCTYEAKELQVAQSCFPFRTTFAGTVLSEPRLHTANRGVPFSPRSDSMNN